MLFFLWACAPTGTVTFHGLQGSEVEVAARLDLPSDGGFTITTRDREHPLTVIAEPDVALSSYWCANDIDCGPNHLPSPPPMTVSYEGDAWPVDDESFRILMGGPTAGEVSWEADGGGWYRARWAFEPARSVHRCSDTTGCAQTLVFLEEGELPPVTCPLDGAWVGGSCEVGFDSHAGSCVANVDDTELRLFFLDFLCENIDYMRQTCDAVGGQLTVDC